MSQYHCVQCDEVKNNDYEPCVESPDDPKGIDLICPSCEGDNMDADEAKIGYEIRKSQLTGYK